MGQTGGGLEVQAFQTLAQGNVVFGLEIKGLGVPQMTNLNVIVFAFTGRHIFVRKVRDAGQEVVELLL